MTEPLRLYWDTGVFICLINAASEKSRRDVCEHILRKAKENHVVICTSTFTIAEVIRPKGITFPTPLTPDQVSKLEGMFRWPWLKKYQVDEAIAFRAARLARETGLKPADAVHAATALASACLILQRWDRDFDKVKHLIRVEPPKFLDDIPLLASPDESISPAPDTFEPT